MLIQVDAAREAKRRSGRTEGGDNMAETRTRRQWSPRHPRTCGRPRRRRTGDGRMSPPRPGLSAATVYLAGTGVLLLQTAAPAPADERWLGVEFLIASDGHAGDEFGWAMATDGRHLAVNARFGHGRGLSAGSVYLFGRAGRTQLRRFIARDGMSNDEFGTSLDIDGAEILIGARGHDVDARNCGAAYLFDIHSGELLQKFVSDLRWGDDRFGERVALADDYIVIASPRYHYPDGGVHVYERATHELLYLLGANGAGAAIATEGNVAAIALRNDPLLQFYDLSDGRLFREIIVPRCCLTSAVLLDDRILMSNNLDRLRGVKGGAAWLMDAETTFYVAELSPPGAAGGDEVGLGIALSAAYAIVGSPGADLGDDISDAGSVTLFDQGNGVRVTDVQRLTPIAYERFGNSIAIADDVLFVGAPSDLSLARRIGRVYVYEPAPTFFYAHVEGDCPGRLQVLVGNATPGGDVALVYGTTRGQQLIFNGPCPGITIDIRPPYLPGSPALATTNDKGEFIWSGETPASLCGNLNVQAIDLTTCAVSNIVVVE